MAPGNGCGGFDYLLVATVWIVAELVGMVVEPWLHRLAASGVGYFADYCHSAAHVDYRVGAVRDYYEIGGAEVAPPDIDFKAIRIDYFLSMTQILR